MSGGAADARSPARPTVFGAPNQEEMIARIDSTTEDDLASPFFRNSLQDVEAAAVRMFDIGIRTLTDDPGQSPHHAFGTRAPDGAGTSSPSAVGQPVAEGTGSRFDDPAVRAAFILGGPDAMLS
jgi:hypothetical protein